MCAWFVSEWLVGNFIFKRLRADLFAQSQMISSIANTNKKSKVGDRSRRWPESSLFDSYYTKVQGRELLLSLDCSPYSWSVPYNAEC